MLFRSGTGTHPGADGKDCGGVKACEAVKLVVPASLAERNVLCYDNGRFQALQTVKDRGQT